MKTSNKLLIALAVSLIIIPIIVIAVNVKMNYKNEKAHYKNLKENTDFKSALDGYAIKELPDFSAVNLNDGNGSYINFVIVKSDKSGVKIPTGLTEIYDVKVDEGKVLQFAFKNSDKKFSNALTVYIYAKAADNFTVAKANGFTLDIQSDSVMLNVVDVKRVSLQNLAAIGALTIKANNVEDLRFDNEKNDKVNVDLNNSNFSCLKSPFQSLNINASGKSNIEIYGDENDKAKYSINNLSIKTAKTSVLNIDYLNVLKSSGSLSDSTKANASAHILKTMFNK